MRILDIDLDFFLIDFPLKRYDDNRLDDNEYSAWSPQQVEEFLEKKCYLSKENPIPGKFVIKHDEVLIDMVQRVQEGIWLAPFDVVHLDSHADLGFGDGAFLYIMSDLIKKPHKERALPFFSGNERLCEGNYLAYAIALRLIKKLTYVHHPDSRDDIFRSYMKNFDFESKAIQLKKCNRSDLEKIDNIYNLQILGLEPEVEFEKNIGPEYQADNGFDFIYLCQSPQYTPESSDKLIPIVRQYFFEN
jgi:hypothetical protein